MKKKIAGLIVTTGISFAGVNTLTPQGLPTTIIIPKQEIQNIQPKVIKQSETSQTYQIDNVYLQHNYWTIVNNINTHIPTNADEQYIQQIINWHPPKFKTYPVYCFYWEGNGCVAWNTLPEGAQNSWGIWPPEIAPFGLPPGRTLTDYWVYKSFFIQQKITGIDIGEAIKRDTNLEFFPVNNYKPGISVSLNPSGISVTVTGWFNARKTQFPPATLTVDGINFYMISKQNLVSVNIGYTPYVFYKIVYKAFLPPPDLRQYPYVYRRTFKISIPLGATCINGRILQSVSTISETLQDIALFEKPWNDFPNRGLIFTGVDSTAIFRYCLTRMPYLVSDKLLLYKGVLRGLQPEDITDLVYHSPLNYLHKAKWHNFILGGIPLNGVEAWSVNDDALVLGVNGRLRTRNWNDGDPRWGNRHVKLFFKSPVNVDTLTFKDGGRDDAMLLLKVKLYIEGQRWYAY